MVGVLFARCKESHPNLPRGETSLAGTSSRRALSIRVVFPSQLPFWIFGVCLNLRGCAWELQCSCKMNDFPYPPTYQPIDVC